MGETLTLLHCSVGAQQFHWRLWDTLTSCTTSTGSLLHKCFEHYSYTKAQVREVRTESKKGGLQGVSSLVFAAEVLNPHVLCTQRQTHLSKPKPTSRTLS